MRKVHDDHELRRNQWLELIWNKRQGVIERHLRQFMTGGDWEPLAVILLRDDRAEVERRALLVTGRLREPDCPDEERRALKAYCRQLAYVDVYHGRASETLWRETVEPWFLPDEIRAMFRQDRNPERDLELYLKATENFPMSRTALAREGGKRRVNRLEPALEAARLIGKRQKGGRRSAPVDPEKR